MPIGQSDGDPASRGEMSANLHHLGGRNLLPAVLGPPLLATAAVRSTGLAQDGRTRHQLSPAFLVRHEGPSHGLLASRPRHTPASKIRVGDRRPPGSRRAARLDAVCARVRPPLAATPKHSVKFQHPHSPHPTRPGHNRPARRLISAAAATATAAAIALSCADSRVVTVASRLSCI